MANKIRNTNRNFHAPALPMAPTEYNQALTHQRDSTLRFYFQNIDEALSQALQYDSDDIIDGSIPNSKLENSTVSFGCLLYTSPSPRDGLLSRMPSSA